VEEVELVRADTVDQQHGLEQHKPVEVVVLRAQLDRVPQLQRVELQELHKHKELLVPHFPEQHWLEEMDVKTTAVRVEEDIGVAEVERITMVLMVEAAVVHIQIRHIYLLCQVHKVQLVRVPQLLQVIQILIM
jgi:hypothetical protein